MDKEYDFLVIGGGSAGYAAARTAREYCDRVAIVDKGPDLGGLCILRGCMPSKTVIYSAEILHLAREAQRFALDIPKARPDMQAMLRRKRAMVEEFASYRRDQLTSDRYDLYRQTARFAGENTVELDDGTRISSKRIFVSTGSVAAVPDIPGLAGSGCWTSDDVLDLDFVPPSVITLGGGVVACELTQYLRRLGSRVIQIQRSPRILREVSSEAAKVVETAFRDEGIDLRCDTALERIERDPSGGYKVSFRHRGEPAVVRADHLFNALGRRPAIGGLDLDRAGVEVAKSGQIAVNEFQQSTNPVVYAGGDVTGPYEIVHLAILQGELAARHAFGKPADPVAYHQRTAVVFTDPQVATVGMSIAEAAQKGIDIREASYPFDDHGKSILMEARRGYVKAWCDARTGHLAGAECVGKDAGELIHSMAVAVTLNAKVRDVLTTQWYHPTLSEIWSYPLEDLAE